MNQDYLTILTVDNDRETAQLLLRVHKKLIIPFKICLILSSIMLVIRNFIPNDINLDFHILYNFTLGIFVGMSMPILLYKIIVSPILYVVFIYAIILSLSS